MDCVPKNEFLQDLERSEVIVVFFITAYLSDIYIIIIIYVHIISFRRVGVRYTYVYSTMCFHVLFSKCISKSLLQFISFVFESVSLYTVYILLYNLICKKVTKIS